MRFKFFAAFVLVLGAISCAAPTVTPDDETSIDAEEEALSANANFGYFMVTRRDMRRCMYPICGGFYVKRVNEAKTRCVDGKLAEECYVASIDLSSLSLSPAGESEFRGSFESGKALIRAKTYKQRFDRMVFGKLKANEGWLGATGATPDGTFYRAADNGTRCITTPCPSLTATQLNSRDTHTLVGVDLTGTTPAASPEALDSASSALGTEEGILLSGAIMLPKCIPGSDCGPKAVASEFYLRVKNREGATCGVSLSAPCGAGQYCAWDAADMCGAADAPGKCTVRPEICTRIYKPVCACDGNTYGNSCEAAAAGASVSSEGPCGK